MVAALSLIVSACLPDADLSDEQVGTDDPMEAGSGGAIPMGASSPSTPPKGLVLPAADDGLPPVLGPVVVLEEACFAATVTVNKMAAVQFVVQVGEAILRVPGQPQAGGVVEARGPLWGVPPATAGQVHVEATDQQGRTSTSAASALTTPPDRPRLVITEILANPIGSEYTQEYVELWNLTSESLSLAGFVISDASGKDALPDVRVPAGGYALIVAEDFDPNAVEDPSPAPGAVIVRVTGRIGRDGLGNNGEPVTLTSADGQVVSDYSGWINTSATTWNGRSIHRVPQDQVCDADALWTDRPQPPTPGW